MVIEGVELLQIGGGQLLSQPPLHLIGQGRKQRGPVRQGGGDILRGILRGRKLLGGRLRRLQLAGGSQPLGAQALQGGLGPFLGPLQAVQRSMAEQVQV